MPPQPLRNDTSNVIVMIKTYKLKTSKLEEAKTAREVRTSKVGSSKWHHKLITGPNREMQIAVEITFVKGVCIINLVNNMNKM